MICPNCHAEFPDDSQYCLHCGTAVARNRAPLSSGFPKPAGIIAAIVAVAVIAVAVIALSSPKTAAVEQGVQAPTQTDGNTAQQASQTQAEAEPAPVTYSYETIALEDSASSADDYRGKPPFSYLKLSSSEPNPVIDKLNAEMKDAAEAALEQEMTVEIYESGVNSPIDGEFYTAFNYSVTYFDEGIACIVENSGTIMPGAAHGMPAFECRIVNLATGEELKAADLVDLTTTDLRLMAWQAADAYLNSTNSIYDSAADAFMGSSVSEGVPDTAAMLYLTPDGVAAMFGAYVIGSFADGTPSLLVCDYDGKSIATGARYEYYPAESGSMTVGSERATASKSDNSPQQAAKEKAAIDFAEQYYTNISFPDPTTDMEIDSIDDWEERVESYFEPGSAAEAKFQNELNSNPIRGLSAGCVVTDSEVVSSSGDEVVVSITYVGTQNPIEGWSKGEGHTVTFACRVGDSGLISSYDISR